MNPLLKKLNYKNQERILILNSPNEFHKSMAEIKMETEVDRNENTANNYVFVLIFVKSCNEIIRITGKLEEFTAPSAILWFAYPKKSSKKYKSDINRDDGWQPIGDLGYEPVRQVAIDDDWSALRFRKAEEIKTMKRSSSMAISKEGKTRTTGEK